MTNDPNATTQENEDAELSEGELEQVAGGRSPAEEFVLGRENIFGGTSGGAGGSGGGAGGGGAGNLAAHELAHVVQQGSGGTGGGGRGKK